MSETTTPTAYGSAVMPQVPTPESTVEELAALDALHFAWQLKTLAEVDREMSTYGGLFYTPTGVQLPQLRAWLTGTDERISHVAFCTNDDPRGFANVAREVVRLTENELMNRYMARRAEVKESRYMVRTVPQMAAVERAQMLEGFEGAACRYDDTPESKQGSGYREAAEGIRRGWGYVLWDRANHRYVATVWRNLPDEIEAERVKYNRRDGRISR